VRLTTRSSALSTAIKTAQTRCTYFALYYSRDPLVGGTRSGTTTWARTIITATAICCCGITFAAATNAEPPADFDLSHHPAPALAPGVGTGIYDAHNRPVDTCTAGWLIHDGNAQPGLFTAGHCDDDGVATYFNETRGLCHYGLISVIGTADRNAVPSSKSNPTPCVSARTSAKATPVARCTSATPTAPLPRSASSSGPATTAARLPN
jgi:hypothetical protein